MFDNAIESAVAILRKNTAVFTDKFQDSTTEHNFYEPTENVEWTTGFLTGCYNLAYEFTEDAIFKKSVEVHVESFLDRIEKRIDVDHHDMGFLYSPSCVASYNLNGNETAKRAALLAAENLISRFQKKGQFIQAWGALGVKDNYRLIIDCLLNLPLLYWASEVTGDDSFKKVALAHTDTSLSNLIREDNSTYHTYFFDPVTGLPVKGTTQQGYRDGSAWSRGQAWGMYGTALAYKYTKAEKAVDSFRKISDFFIEHLPDDAIPYWDMDFSDGSNEPKDSSAAAIAICGIYQMAELHSDMESYVVFADKMLSSLARSYAVQDSRKSNGLLLHGVYAKSSPYNPIPKDRGVDECNSWGDYFYLEALMRKTRAWNSYW